jgi:hypothetical protein
MCPDINNAIFWSILEVEVAGDSSILTLQHEVIGGV